MSRRASTFDRLALREQVLINRQMRGLGELNNEFYSVINNFIKLKWVNENPNSYVLTMEGRLRADYIASELFK